MSIARLMQMARAGVPTGPVWTDPDLANATYDSVSFSVAAQGTNVRSPVFSPDGTKMYISDITSKKVFQYSLSTAWDLSTASYASLSSPAAVQSGSIQGVQFKSDGTKMYLFHGGTTIGGAGAVYQYSLSTAWDVSTASYDSVSLTISSFSFNGAFFMTPDGLRLYTINAGDQVFQYDLASAWDLSTATFTALKSALFKAEEESPYGLVLSPSGDKIFIVGLTSDIVAQGTLSTPFDITTATSDLVTFSVAAQDTTPIGLSFKTDGTKMYIIGLDAHSIYQYSTA